MVTDSVIPSHSVPTGSGLHVLAAELDRTYSGVTLLGMTDMLRLQDQTQPIQV